MLQLGGLIGCWHLLRKSDNWTKDDSYNRETGKKHGLISCVKLNKYTAGEIGPGVTNRLLTGLAKQRIVSKSVS
jgi:hypothetical protein